MDADVLVLGGGAAGLAAARAVVEAGRTVEVLEARDRPGGRIRTELVPGLGAVELGAEFVHGEAPLTVALAKAARTRLARVRGRRWEQADDAPRPAVGRWEALGEVLGRLDPGPGDRSVAEAMASVDASPEDRAFALAFLCGYDALDPERASVRAVIEQEGEDAGASAVNSLRVTGGQAALLAPLAEGLTIRTRSRIRAVVHGPQGVEVEAVDALGRSVIRKARRAVVALPIGVLQAGDVRFEPALDWPLDAVAAGAVVRVVLAFDQPFWEERAPKLSFLMGRGTFPTFWAEPGRAAITAWCGGPAARRLSRLETGDRVTQAVHDLAVALGLGSSRVEARVVGWYTHDWVADPLSRGAYSYVAVGGTSRLAALAEPRGALAMAGEHVPGAAVTSTVEAALHSGRRAGQWAATG